MRAMSARLPPLMLVKICGTTSLGDAQAATDAGADYLGMILEHPPSPRSLTLEQALPIRRGCGLPVAAVTVNLSYEQLLELWTELQPEVLQLHGDEPLDLVAGLTGQGIRVWSTLPAAEPPITALQQARDLTGAGCEAILVDARVGMSEDELVYGGTGRRADWALAAALVKEGFRVILAGGLKPGNVAQAIAEVQPWMADVVSGVEQFPGVKDAGLVSAFIRAAKP